MKLMIFKSAPSQNKFQMIEKKEQRKQQQKAVKRFSEQTVRTKLVSYFEVKSVNLLGVSQS